MARKVAIVLLILLLLACVLFAAFLYQAKNSEGITFLNEIRYELGEHKGAEYCKTCHQEIYAQWKNNSRHAVATTAESVRDVIHNLKEHAILNYILGGEDMCHACHGPKAANEGVNCETCHGPALPDASIMDSHEKVFKKNMGELQRDDFCAKCHEIPGWVTPYGDWQKTTLVEQGITCQACHMASPEGARSYHGFDSFAINQTIYENDLSLNDVRLNFPTLTLTIENHIKAHGVPAGGPTRILSLEISFKDAQGKVLHKDGETFAKYHRVMPVLGFWPYEIIADKQLKTREKRPLSFTVPPELEGRIKAIQLTLRFYEVADEHEGDIEKAYFVSEPIMEKEIQI
jgi:hypothetical protein